MHKSRKQIGFTLIEMLVVISIIALLIGILLPALGMAKKQATRYRNNSRVRTVFQAMATYSTGNGDRFPGVNSRGTMIANGEETLESGDGWTTEGRYAIMFKEKVLPPESALSPLDPVNIRFSWNGSNPAPNYVWGQHYSFALSSIAFGKPLNTSVRNFRRDSWRNDGARRSVAVCDRNIGKGSESAPLSTNCAKSIHDDELWKGSTAFNDGHVEFLEQHFRVETRYSSGPLQFDSKLDRGTDNLFESPMGLKSDQGYNALMVHHGYETTNAESRDGADHLAKYQPY